MEKIKIFQVDAFANKLFSGNPAAVCLLDNWLNDKVMQSIALENNLSETAFVIKKKDKFFLRWFTPKVEIDLCGHATLASAHIIYSEMNYKPEYLNVTSSLDNLLKDLSFGLEFETVSGIIPNYKLNSLPLIPLRDGSIRGLEYATIPLQGKLGIQALIDSVKELKKRTKYDETCSLHLHKGSYNLH